MFGPLADVPDIDISDQRMSELLVDIKRNSRNRRLAMVAPIVLAAAVMGAMIAAPPQHGGVAMADAEGADPELPRVFGSNGVWRLAEPIAEDAKSDPGPAAVIEAPTEPDVPTFTLSPPAAADLYSLPTSTSTPPMSTSGQTLDSAPLPESVDTPFEALIDPSELDWSQYRAAIRVDSAPASEAVAIEAAAAEISSSPGPLATAEDTTTAPDASSVDEDALVRAGANPSTPSAEPEPESQAFSTPATIVPISVLVYSAHVSVTVQVVDDDSSVIDWCNTRVDWGDGSVSRVAGADDVALCTASCEHTALSSAASAISDPEDETFNGESPGGINATMQFDHDYLETIDAAPRIFVATGDGCSYTLAELELPPFVVAPR